MSIKQWACSSITSHMSLTYLYLVKNDSLWGSSYILGVFIDPYLSFKSHPEKKKNSVKGSSSISYSLSSNENHMSTEATEFHKFFKTFFSVMEFSLIWITVWRAGQRSKILQHTESTWITIHIWWKTLDSVLCALYYPAGFFFSFFLSSLLCCIVLYLS